MAHLDPASGQWVSDADGPAPQDAGSIGMQVSPGLPPIPPPLPGANPGPLVEPTPAPALPPPAPSPPPPVAPPAAAAPPPVAPAPVLPPVGTLPPARPQLITSQKLDTPEHVAALRNVDADNAAAVGNSQAAGDLKVKGAEANATNAQGVSDAVMANLAAKDARQKAFAAQQIKDNENIAKATADGLKDPDADESFGHRLLRALAIGLGQYSAAMNHTSNAAADIFEADRKANIARQKAKVDAAKEAGKINAEQAQADLNALDAKELGQIKAFQAKWQAESARLGIPQARIDATKTTIDLQKQEDEARAKLLDEDRVTVRDMTPAEVRGPKVKGAGGGGGNPDAMAKFIDAAGALKPGEAIPREMAALAAAARIKPTQIASQVDLYRNSGDKATGIEGRANKSGGAGGGVDTKLIVRNVDGSPAGQATTARAVPALQSDLRTNTQAVEQLEKLRDANQWTSTGPKFHDAVLALAATTTAGKTDTTTAHEKGAITNALGMPDRDAIEAKIAQTKARIAAIQAQLNPLPDGYDGGSPQSLPAKARAARAVMNGEPAPARAAPAAPKTVPKDVIDQAKDEVRNKGPHAASAQKLLDQQGITVL